MAYNGRENQPHTPSANLTTFFKIILDTTLKSGKIKIPNKFTRIHGGNLPNPIFLKAPDGLDWEIYWTENDDGGIRLEKGWKELATYYSLSHGHLVLFKYKGTCNMKVHIYDASGLEIMYPFHSTHNADEINDYFEGPQAHKKSRTRSSGVVGQSSNLPQHVQTRDDLSQGPQARKKLRTCSSGVVGQRSNLPLHVKTEDDLSHGPQPRKKLRKRSIGVVGQRSNLPLHVQSKDDLSQGPQPRKKLRKRSIGVVEQRSNLPLHVQSKDDLSQGPQPRKKLRKRSIGVVEQRSNLPLHVQSEDDLSQGPQPRKKLRKHSIGVVAQSSKLPQRVQITSDQPQEHGGGAIESQNRAAISTVKAPSFTVILKHTYATGFSMIVPLVFIKEHLKENEGDDFLLRILNGRSWRVNFRNHRFCTGWKNFTSDNHLNMGDVCLFEFTKSQMSFEVTIIRVQGYGDPQRILDMKYIADVPIQAMQEAETFRSRHPFFKVIIKANQKGDYRPRVPVAFMRKYFAKKHMLILQYAYKSWDVHLVGKVRTKLSKGWFQFAKESNVQNGDVCIFELINEVGPVFDVHIFKGHSLVKAEQ